MIKNIGILTSGGDSPGMNAVIRSVVKSSIFNKLNIFGIMNGYFGLYNNYIKQLYNYNVSNILNKGGTILGCDRFEDFVNYDIRLKSLNNLKKFNIDILIIVGGNGSYLGALELVKMGFPCMCIPGTIDNDIPETDFSIGFFTALETITKSIDKLKDTASSHNRIFIVEVMGRNCGNLALFSSISGGCEFVIIPEIKFDENNLIYKINNGFIKNKKNFIIIITENTYNINLLIELIKNKTGKIAKSIILSYLQRGGIPSSLDRILASKMGNYVINLIIKKKINKCIGIKNNRLFFYNIENIKNLNNNTIKYDLFKLNNFLF